VVANYQRLRRQQLLREAEGYLELITAFSDQWPIHPESRRRLAMRCLETLEGMAVGEQQADVLLLRGQAYRILEQHQEAVEIFRAAVELDSENIHIWLALGWCYKRTGRLDLAIESLEEALCIDSAEGIIHLNLACYWSLARNAKLAVAYLGRALELDPNYRERVDHEADFNPIRNHPEFLALTSVIV
jgi:tetratricopeptide (TPR) repeat protein